MSFSVDDLVNSFNSSHIGQEARDLAALQAQLAEALFGVSSSTQSTSTYYNSSFPQSTNTRGMHVDIPTPRGRSQHTRPCNTPLARTPSSSVGLNAWMQASEGKRGNNSNANSNAGFDEMDEDERMVEELLLPSSSTSNSFSSSMSYPTSSSYQSQLSWPQQENSDTSSSVPSTPSLFATTDPFYLAQVQAAQAYSNNASRNYTALAAGNGSFSSGFNFGNNSFTNGNNNGGDNNNNMNGESQYHAFAHTQACGELPAYQCATAF